jgi:hypothetical protein
VAATGCVGVGHDVVVCGGCGCGCEEGKQLEEEEEIQMDDDAVQGQACIQSGLTVTAGNPGQQFARSIDNNSEWV